MIVVQTIDRDSTDPTDGIVVLLDSAPVQVSFHEGFLHGVGGDLGVAARQCECTHQPPIVRAKERVNGRDDLDIFHLAHRGQRVHHKFDTP